MADTVNSIGRVFNVSGLNRIPHSGLVSLRLMVYTTHRHLYQDALGNLHRIRDSMTALDRIRTTRFHVSLLSQPTAMNSLLCEALHLPVDHASLRGLSWELLKCVVLTGSLRLVAEFALVRTTVMGPDAIEILKVNGGFESHGGELGTCSVCLEDLCGNLIRTPCSHLYHESCLASWLDTNNNSCPLCRRLLL